MHNITLLPADKYIVVNKTILSDESRKILSILYQPIIGSLSVNLYFTLWSQLDNLSIMSGEHFHHNLMSAMQISLDEVYKARKKLEAVGLLKTYIKVDSINSYIYELYSPLSANSFLTHPILSVILYNTVEKKEYNRIVEYFKLPSYNTNDYKDISASFSDVFITSSYDKNVPTLEKDIKKRKTNSLKIDNNIDFDLIISSLPQSSINDRTFNDDIKDLITKLAFVYNLDNLEVIDIIRSSIEEKGIIDKMKLRKNARNYYQFEHNGELPSLIDKVQPKQLKSEVSDNSSESKMIYTFDNTKPYDFLKSKQNGAKPTSRDLKLLEALAVDYKLNPGVINVLIDYVLKVNNNKLTIGFVETIAGEWKRRKIEKVEDAVRIAKQEYKNHLEYNKKSNKKKDIKEVDTPDWFDKSIEKNEASTSDIEKMNELLNEFK